jgi:hypothetical protein
MTPSSSESTSLQEEVDFLRRQVDRLQELVGELLAKNQHLRETLEADSIRAGARRNIGANETADQRLVDGMKFTAGFVYAAGHWNHERPDHGGAESGDDA